jgi:hypothetical protein
MPRGATSSSPSRGEGRANGAGHRMERVRWVQTDPSVGDNEERDAPDRGPLSLLIAADDGESDVAAVAAAGVHFV